MIKEVFRSLFGLKRFSQNCIGATMVIVALLLIPACSEQVQPSITLSGKTMGTTYRVKLVPMNRAIDENGLQSEVQQELDRLESLMSTYMSESELSRFNAEGTNEPFPLSKDTYQVIEYAQHISQVSGGAFDITVGPLVDFWGFGSKGLSNDPPSEENIQNALKGIGYEKLKLDESDYTVSKLEQVELNLSAIAKGYAVDKVASLIERQGVMNYLVEVGGETRALGLSDKGVAWRLGIEKPDELGQTALAVVQVDGMALATSGDYRNYFVSGGKRYSHTISPNTGRPVEHNLASVSVLAKSCMEADALATALLVMGEEKGYNFAIEKNLNAYFIYREQDGFKIRVTDGFKPYLLQ